MLDKMYSVILKKDGFYSGKEKLPWDFDILNYWNKPIEMVEDITLEDLANFISQDDTCVLLLELLTNSSITPFLEEIKTDCEPSDTLSCIEISKFWEYRSYKKGTPEFYEALDCVGVYKEPRTSSNFPEHTDYVCALDFTPWNMLKHLPIRLSNEGEIISHNPYKKEKVKVYFTVRDFFQALFDELCFHGDPEYRDGRIEDMKNRIKEVEEGKVNTIPWEEVKKKIEDKLK